MWFVFCVFIYIGYFLFCGIGFKFLLRSYFILNFAVSFSLVFQEARVVFQGRSIDLGYCFMMLINVFLRVCLVVVDLVTFLVLALFWKWIFRYFLIYSGGSYFLYVQQVGRSVRVVFMATFFEMLFFVVYLEEMRKGSRFEYGVSFQYYFQIFIQLQTCLAVVFAFRQALRGGWCCVWVFVFVCSRGQSSIGFLFFEVRFIVRDVYEILVWLGNLRGFLGRVLVYKQQT